MDQNPELFTYPQEPLGEDEIRLVDIEPGSGDAVVQCKLGKYTRAGAPDYKALSYTWGSVEDTHSVLVDGKTFWLTKNLQEALLGIRDEETTVRLWTDRICINQEDVVERNAQVKRMGKTYSQAEEVIVWLGPSSDFARCLEDVQYACQHYKEFSEEDWQVYWPTMLHLLTRPYFARLWVVPEVFLAKKGTVILGHERCDLSALIGFGFPVVMRVHTLLNTQKAYGEDYLSSVASFLLMMELRARVHNSEDLTLGLLANKCRGRLCQDPRDYVFALAGIAEHLGIACQEVDYESTADQVFLRFATSELQNNVNELLRSNTYSLSADATPNLPTWTADLSTFETFHVGDIGFFSAGGRSRDPRLHRDNFSADSRILKLAGYVFDKISLASLPDFGVVTPSSDTSEVTEEYFPAPWSPEEMRAKEEEYLSIPDSSSPYGDYLSRLQAFWRTFILGRYSVDYKLEDDHRLRAYEDSDFEWPADDSGAAYEIYIGRAECWNPPASSSSASHPIHRPFTREFENATLQSAYNALLLTEKCFYALASKGVFPGDEVVVVPGLTMPIVLRQQERSGRYTFRGPAYVHGIMWGEAMEELEKNEPTIFEIE